MQQVRASPRAIEAVVLPTSVGRCRMDVQGRGVLVGEPQAELCYEGAASQPLVPHVQREQLWGSGLCLPARGGGDGGLSASQVQLPLFTYRYQSWNMFNCFVEMDHKWAIKVSHLSLEEH